MTMHVHTNTYFKLFGSVIVDQFVNASIQNLYLRGPKPSFRDAHFESRRAEGTNTGK